MRGGFKKFEWLQKVMIRDAQASKDAGALVKPVAERRAG